MGQLDCGGTLINVRTRAALTACAAAISLSLSTPTHALSVEPVVDTVLSVVKLHEPEGNAASDNKGEASRAATSTKIRSSPNKAPDAILQPSTTIEAPAAAPVIAAPLEQLPSIETTEMRLLSASAYRPAASLAVSPVVLGTTNDTVMPLQSSNHGWKLFGVAWYWWALIITAGYYLIRRLRIRQRRRRANTAIDS
jgi:hypothetical protein